MTTAGHDEDGLRRVRVYSMFVILLEIVMFPFYAMLSSTFKSGSGILSAPVTFVPSQLPLGAHVDVWTQTDVLLWTANSFVISLGTVVLTFLLAIPVTYSRARNDFMGKWAFLLAVLIIQMFTPVALIAGLFDVISRLGLFDTCLAVIVPAAAFTLPFSIWVLYDHFKTAPVELEESAHIDGASQLQVLMKTVLPLIKPALVAGVTYTLLYTWNQSLFVLTFPTDSGKYNVPRGIFSMVGALQTDWRMMPAASVIGIIPLLALFTFLERHIVAGMTVGVVKE